MMELEVLSYDMLKCKTDLKGQTLVILFVTMRELTYLEERTMVTTAAEEVAVLMMVEENTVAVVECFPGKEVCSTELVDYLVVMVLDRLREVLDAIQRGLRPLSCRVWVSSLPRRLDCLRLHRLHHQFHPSATLPTKT